MPSIEFINFDNESIEFDLSTVSNAQALKEGFKHLDKAVYKTKNKTKNETKKEKKES